MNIHAQIIVDEAVRRGITAAVVDEESNLFRLQRGGRAVLCHESLTDRTPSTAFLVCRDRRLTRRMLARAGFRVPLQFDLGNSAPDWGRAHRFVRQRRSVAVKPATGEQGGGVTLDVAKPTDVERAVAYARQFASSVILEEFVPGRNLRIIVIGHRYVAAIERRPPAMVGTGSHSIRALVEQRNAALREQTRGESEIPCDEETERVIKAAGYTWGGVLPAGQVLEVRQTASIHAGGTSHDVTTAVSAYLRQVAEEASRTLALPVVGVDFLVPDVSGEQYVIIAANARPKLLNHETQPVVKRFVDFLYPETARAL